MASKSILSNPALKDQNVALSEEWVNFSKRIGEVSNLVRDLASGDKARAEAATVLADKYLAGKLFVDDNVEMTIKDDRTVINKAAFREVEKNGQIDKDAWMKEVSKDVERRAKERRIRKERADTLNTQAIKAFRRRDYEKALSCYNKAIEQIKDNPMYYCDRALTNIKLGRFEKVFGDCDLALRLYEKSFKARLYKAKAHKELEETEKLEECRKELYEMFPQHLDLIKYFLDKTQNYEEEEEEEEKDDEGKDAEEKEENKDDGNKEGGEKGDGDNAGEEKDDEVKEGEQKDNENKEKKKGQKE